MIQGVMSSLGKRASLLSQRRGLHTTRALQKAGDWMDGSLHQDTEFVHNSVSPDPKTGAILTPLFLSTTFVQESVGKYLAKGFSYSRTNNPTVSALEAKVAAIEGGIGSTCVGTGMAATTIVLSTFLQQGDHCVISNCSYGGTNRICREQFMKYGIEFSFVDMSCMETVRKAMKPNTKLVFSETPANPTLVLVDLEELSKIAKEHGAVHVCDSTFATPLMVKPLDWGADLVIQSLTKFYGGDNVGLGGAVIAKSQEHLDRIKLCQNMHGNIMAPQVAFHMLQTTKTMHLRVQRQSETATKIANFLETHSKVGKVCYPGTTHPQKDLADKYHRNGVHGAMLWFDLKGGDPIKLMDNIERPWSLCENLGATESILTACAVMTHANMRKEDRLKVGIVDGFIRVSCGIEDSGDLIKALGRALDKC
jgi:cystathionine beta-lyase/cystathionine gamma-synthase